MNGTLKWNWQKEGWPHFAYDSSKISAFEQDFLLRSGYLAGSFAHLSKKDQQSISIDWMQNEAYKSTEIEGEILNHESLHASLLRNLGISTDARRIPPAEQGISEMMIDLYQNFETPLSHEALFRWHEMILRGRLGLRDLARYRTDQTPMQIISGPVDHPKVHFEAPPQETLSQEMQIFIDWFNQTAPGGVSPMAPLLRAGITHLHFISIHPFEDGNGRLARALVEKSISQTLKRPALLALSQTIQKNRKQYYLDLELNNQSNQIDHWLISFSKTILAAQKQSTYLLDFLISKTKFYQRHQDLLNPRQNKVIERIFKEGPEGFEGGLSAEKYIKITNTSRSTATRDLQDLVQKSILSQKGNLKGTRYEIIL